MATLTDRAEPPKSSCGLRLATAELERPRYFDRYAC